MNIHSLHNLQEAYLDVYDNLQLDEYYKRYPEERVSVKEVILGYLLDEGYSDCIGSAEIIFENMSDEWLYESIIDALRKKYGLAPGDSVTQMISDKAAKLYRQRKGQTPERKKTYGNLSRVAFRKANPVVGGTSRENMTQLYRDTARERDADHYDEYRERSKIHQHGRSTHGRGSLPKGSKLYRQTVRGVTTGDDPFEVLRSAAR